VPDSAWLAVVDVNDDIAIDDDIEYDAVIGLIFPCGVEI
jgi:hypothetical protein